MTVTRDYSLRNLEAHLANLKLLHAKLYGQRALIQEELESYKEELSGVHASLELYDKARIFLQKLSEAARRVAKVQIENIVTKALQYVFGKNYSFRVDIRYTASRPEAEFLVLTDYGNRVVESVPTIGKGGGIVDLLAVALKFALLELVNYEGPIWMDEPFKHVSEDFIPAVGKLLAFMGETSGRQIIIITHNSELAKMSGKTVKVVQKAGSARAM